MEESKDIRWIQRYKSYERALQRVLDITTKRGPESLSDLEEEGLIQRFEYTVELAWKTLQDLLHYKGYIDISGPKPVLQQAFSDQLIKDHDPWRKMLKARNITSHMYDEDEAFAVIESIYKEYAPLLKKLDAVLRKEVAKTKEDHLF